MVCPFDGLSARASRRKDAVFLTRSQAGKRGLLDSLVETASRDSRRSRAYTDSLK
jgi:hypothetical protein